MLREVASSLVFIGIFAHDMALISGGQRAELELEQAGFTLVTPPQTVRVYPWSDKAVNSPSPALPHVAASWEPGVIRLRPNPQGGVSALHYLRHELAHQANYVSCNAKLPGWADEARAISFSGEVEVEGKDAEQGLRPSDLEHLRGFVRVNSPLDARAYSVVRSLVRQYGWPPEPCAVSPEIRARVAAEEISSEPLSALLMSMPSGRVIETRGGWQRSLPPGSLMKLLYVSALRETGGHRFGDELARSDTAQLAAWRSHLDAAYFERLTAGLRRPLRTIDGLSARTLLGERDDQGEYPFAGTLAELSRAIRNGVLGDPQRYGGLERNGQYEGSTGWGRKVPQALVQAGAMIKTGTVSDRFGRPILGQVAILWPSTAPHYLALLRRGGVRGAQVLEDGAEILTQWSTAYAPARTVVRVRLLPKVPANSWEIAPACNAGSESEIIPPSSGDANWRYSACGWWRLTTTARNALPLRYVRGALKAVDGELLLETDAESYVDGVTRAEGDELRGAARTALRAVVFWNGVHGEHRHPASHSLCDTTHCMVFRGAPRIEEMKTGERTDPHLLKILDDIAHGMQEPWFEFSKGGSATWHRVLEHEKLRGGADGVAVLHISRVRTRDGDVRILVQHPDYEEQLSCEELRRRLTLPSCPAKITFDAVRQEWLAEGFGSGHGRGLDLTVAQRRAAEGATAEQILREAFRD